MNRVVFEVSETDGDVLSRTDRALLPDRFFPVVARRTENLYRRHFRNLDRTRANRLGGSRTHYFADAAQKTFAETEGRGFQVRTNKPGINLLFHGGTVKPKNGDWLTLPARSEYHGHRAREFNDLRFEPGSQPDTAKLINDQDQVAYWLKDEVTHDPDPGILPTQSEVEDEIRQGATDHLNRQRTGT